MLQWAAWLCSWPDGFASGVHRYVQGFHPDMMEVVYSWVNGARFVDICSMTTAFEGTVIRVIRRLEELVRQLADSAKVCAVVLARAVCRRWLADVGCRLSQVIGDAALEEKFTTVLGKVGRDIRTSGESLHL